MPQFARVENQLWTVDAQALADLSLDSSAAVTDALRSELPRIPVRLRAPTLSLYSAQLASQHAAAEQVAAGAVSLVAVRAGVPTSTGWLGGGGGDTVSDIEQGVMTITNGGYAGIVPDGIATVTVHYPATPGLRAVTVTSDVVGNVFATTLKRWQTSYGQGGLTVRIGDQEFHLPPEPVRPKWEPAGDDADGA